MMPKTSLQPGQHQWHMNVAGTSCTAFSTMGKQERWQHASSRPFYVWMFAKHVMEEDFFCHENVPLFDVEVLRQALPSGWVLHSWVTNPVDMGWPVRRPRLAVALCVWGGT